MLTSPHTFDDLRVEIRHTILKPKHKPWHSSGRILLFPSIGSDLDSRQISTIRELVESYFLPSEFDSPGLIMIHYVHWNEKWCGSDCCCCWSQSMRTLLLMDWIFHLPIVVRYLFKCKKWRTLHHHLLILRFHSRLSHTDGYDYHLSVQNLMPPLYISSCNIFFLLMKMLQVLQFLYDRMVVHKKAIKFCQNILGKKAIDSQVVCRSDLSRPIRDVDLVITIGGDGTLLHASHFMDDSIPVLGVNSDPTRPEEVCLISVSA